MTLAKRQPSELTELDRILATEEELLPSSGFLATVMERVQQEAAAPAPIPFPWVRALPGIGLATVVLGWGAVQLGRSALSAFRGVTFSAPHITLAGVSPLRDAAWVGLALAVSLASWLLSKRMAGNSGLL